MAVCLPSVLWRCWLGGRKGIRPVKAEWWGAGVVVCLEQGADLHMAQLMPLLLTVCCFSKIQIGSPFWYQLTRVVLEKGPLNVCVCVLQASWCSTVEHSAWYPGSSASDAATSCRYPLHARAADAADGVSVCRHAAAAIFVWSFLDAVSANRRHRNPER